ncbi:hypothetical protein Tco_0547994 [Tanacetum coccineum]
MNPQETQQVVVRDEKWVPSTERVKISSTNVILETTVPQKEETFQVIIDIIKNSTSELSMLKSLERFWISVQEWKVKNLHRYKMMMIPSPSSLTLAIKVHYTSTPTCLWITCISHGELWQQLSTSLSEKTASNEKLRKSRIDILWGMFYRENVDYPELIWEDFAFQIDHRKEKNSRCETMTFP